VAGLEEVAVTALEGVYDGDGGVSSSDGAAAGARVGPDAAVGDAVYAGGGSFEGTVNAFIPGRSGRLVAGDGLVSGLGFLPGMSPVFMLKSTGPLKLGVAGCSGS
jgi:hypothetical protein